MHRGPSLYHQVQKSWCTHVSCNGAMAVTLIFMALLKTAAETLDLTRHQSCWADSQAWHVCARQTMQLGCHSQLEKIREHMSSCVCVSSPRTTHTLHAYEQTLLICFMFSFESEYFGNPGETRITRRHSILLFIKGTVKLRENWSSTFFVFLTFFFSQSLL